MSKFQFWSSSLGLSLVPLVVALFGFQEYASFLEPRLAFGLVVGSYYRYKHEEQQEGTKA